MFNTVKRIAVGLAALSISVGAFAQSDRAMDLDALLKELEEGQFAQSQQNKQR
ncbi:MAG: energy transducer TonB, partial [Pseudomonadota bacterium]|nr:energy transducer TonB [Pseudomonadota bacterium]